MTERFFRIKDLISVLGVSRTHLYSLRKNGNFPKGKILSSRITLWTEREILAWMENKNTLEKNNELT